MTAKNVLDLRRGQVFTIPGIDGAFECLRTGNFSVDIKRLRDGQEFAVDCETIVELVDTAEPQQTIPLPLQPVIVQMSESPPAAVFVQPSESQPPFNPVAA